MVQQTKWARDKRRTTKTATKKTKMLQYKVTQTVENVNTTSMCCPRLIKREKPMQNVKNSCVPPWVTFQSFKTTKMEVFFKSGEEEGAAGPFHADLIRGHITLATHNYKTATLPLRFTKMPLWASNVDPLTLLTWKRHGNDVAMMWKFSSTKY